MASTERRLVLVDASCVRCFVWLESDMKVNGNGIARGRDVSPELPSMGSGSFIHRLSLAHRGLGSQVPRNPRPKITPLQCKRAHYASEPRLVQR